MKVSIFLIKFLFIGALFIISNDNLHLGIQEERTVFLNSFSSWIDTLFGHSLEIVGYVVNSEWLPNNEDTSSIPEIIG